MSADDEPELDGPTQSGPSGADGTLETPDDRPGGSEPTDPEDDSTHHADADQSVIDDFVDNAATLLDRGDEVLPLVWTAIFVMAAIPVSWKLLQGHSAVGFTTDIDVATLLVEVGFHATAVVLLAASLPLARTYLLGDEPGPQTVGSGLEVISDHLGDAFVVGIAYYLCVTVGLALCILPGLLAAGYLTPALYMATARDESTFRALLKGPKQLSENSGLFAVVYLGCFAVFIGITLALGALITWGGGPEGVAEMAADPLFFVGASLAAILVAALGYLLYVAMVSIFVTIESRETGQPIR